MFGTNTALRVVAATQRNPLLADKVIFTISPITAIRRIANACDT
jgi:hypothetical protein